MNILTIDFETYYARDFSLTKLTTEEYVRDDNFEVIGVSVKENDNEAHEVVGSAQPFYLAYQELNNKEILNWIFFSTRLNDLHTREGMLLFEGP